MQEPTVDPRSDQELVAAVNDRDAGAFEVLYHRHRDWVIGLAYRITGDHALALDVLQETFFYFLKKFPGFRLTCQLRSFLYPAVRHLALAARRKADRLQSDDSALLELEAPPNVPSSEDTGALLAGALRDLADGHREVLLLRFVDGLSLNEISVALELPLGTVKSRLHHALAALRRDPRTKNFFEQ